MSGGLTLLLTSPRVAGGLLSWPAWQALSSADLVLARDGHHDQADALVEASIPLQRSEFRACLGSWPASWSTRPGGARSSGSARPTATPG